MSKPVTLTELLRRDVSEVKSWVEAARAGAIETPMDFNWHGLAEVAAGRANARPWTRLDAAEVSWAILAIRVYEIVAEDAPTSSKESFVLSLMLLRARLLVAYPQLVDDPQLGVHKITDWFFEGNSLSVEEVRRKSQSMCECTLEELRAMRRMKNRLNVIALLSNCARIAQNSELAEWTKVRDLLP